MPPKKRRSDAAKPPSKVPVRVPVCYFGTEKNPCQVECTRLKEIYTEKEVRLCPTHRRCTVCRNEVDSGEFALMFRCVACMLPEGTPNRLESMCAFRCERCKKFLLKGHELCEEQYQDGAGDDEKLFCADCRDCALQTLVSQLQSENSHLRNENSRLRAELAARSDAPGL
jgi:hypothetical protein